MESGATANPPSDHLKRIAVRESGAPSAARFAADGTGTAAFTALGVEAFVIGADGNARQGSVNRKMLVKHSWKKTFRHWYIPRFPR